MDVFETLSSVFMLLCSMLGIVCALAFIGVVTFYRQCRTLTVLLAFNTTIACLITNVIYACQSIYQLISASSDILCVFRGFLLFTTTGLFYHTMCIQALYRLFVTVFAQRRYLQSTHVVVSVVVLQWLISGMFALPILLTGRIAFQAGSRICQESLRDIFSFMYLGTLIYFVPISFIVSTYIGIVKHMKQNTFSNVIRQRVIEQNRQRRELRLIRRILIIVLLLFTMGFPYVSFFLQANLSYSSSPSYAYRMSFMFICFGQSASTLFTLISTDDVRKALLNIIRGRRVQCVVTLNIPLRAIAPAIP